MKNISISLLTLTLFTPLISMDKAKQLIRKVSSGTLLRRQSSQINVQHEQRETSQQNQYVGKYMLHKLPEDFLFNEFFPRLVSVQWDDRDTAYEGLKALYALSKTCKKFHAYVQRYLKATEPVITSSYWGVFESNGNNEEQKIAARKVLLDVIQRTDHTNKLPEIILILLYMRTINYEINEIFPYTVQKIYLTKDPNLYPRYQLPLVEACRIQDTDIIKLLLRAGADSTLKAWRPMYTQVKTHGYARMYIMEKKEYTTHDILDEQIKNSGNLKNSETYTNAVAIKKLLEHAEKHPEKRKLILS